MWPADQTRIIPHADILQFDVANGHFAAEFLAFPDLVARLRDQTALPVRAQLMVANAVRLSRIYKFAETAADLISLLVESTDAALGLRTATVPPAGTPAFAAQTLLPHLGMLTHFGTVRGQGSGPCPQRHHPPATGRRNIAGAETVVLGSPAFGAPNLKAQMGWRSGLGVNGPRLRGSTPAQPRTRRHPCRCCWPQPPHAAPLTAQLTECGRCHATDAGPMSCRNS